MASKKSKSKPAPSQAPSKAQSSRTATSKPQARPVASRRSLPRFVIIVAIALAVGVVLVAGSFTFAATQEQRDPFCASCHTQPESTFFAREAATASDLASTHHGKGVRCIDCHSGPGLDGRVKAEVMGAHNALLWYTGAAVQPAPLTTPIGDANCLKCHDQITSVRTMENHFHYFLPRWQQQDPNAAKCTTCHESHTTDGRSDIKWLNEQRTVAQCQNCHAKLRDGNE